MSANTPPERGATVLVVEDDRWLRDFLALLLSDEGYCVLEAHDGYQGSQLARERCPDVVLLDLGLPRRSGLQVLADLKADRRVSDTPVLLMTGSTDLSRRAEAAGNVVPVTKPVDIGDLLDRLQAVRA